MTPSYSRKTVTNNPASNIWANSIYLLSPTKYQETLHDVGDSVMLSNQTKELPPNSDENVSIATTVFSVCRVCLPILFGLLLVTNTFRPSPKYLEEFALGSENVALYGTYQGDPIHCGTIVDIKDCLEPAEDRSLATAVFWLGNSQLHAINQPTPNARTAPVLLAERFRPIGTEVLAFSQPNASLQEHQLLFEYLLTYKRPDVVLLPIVFDDMREDRIRAEIRIGFEDASVKAGLAGTALYKKLSAIEHAGDSQENVGGKETIQEKVEMAIDDYLSSHVPIWNARPQVRSWLALKLYQFRNSVLGINPSSKRRIIPTAYRRNIMALNDLLARVREVQTKAIVYIVPLRSDVPPPYILSEYDNFKSEVESIATKYEAHFVNLENTVPEEYWGTKDSTGVTDDQELDFMHFQFEGHIRLERNLAKYVRNIK